MKNKVKQSCDRKNQIIYVGRLDRTKGIDKLLFSWNLIKNKKNAPILIVCGVGPDEKWCLNYIRENNLDHIVKMLGYVDNRDAVTRVAESLALILPTQWYEGFPMTIVEAYGHGTPVLGSEIGNVGNLVIDGVTGYTFNQSSPMEIVGAVEKIINNEIDLSNSTYDYYSNNYSSEKNYYTLEEIYKKIVIDSY